MLYNQFVLLYRWLYWNISLLYKWLCNVLYNFLCRSPERLYSHDVVIHNQLCTFISCVILDCILTQDIKVSCHHVVGPVVEEKSAQRYLTFSLSIVYIRTEDCKVLDDGVSRSAMRLASTNVSYHAFLLLDRRDLCRVFADVSGCVRNVNCITGKEPGIEGRKGQNRTLFEHSGQQGSIRIVGGSVHIVLKS